MRDNHEIIDRFLDQARRRLNLLRWWGLTRSLVLAGAVVMLLGALVYVVQGYQVALWWYALVACAVIAAAGVWALVGRLGRRAAAQRVDSIFSLHDAVTSYLGFRESGQSGGFYELHTKSTAGLVQRLDVRQIQGSPSKRIVIAACVVLAASLMLGLKGPSQKVIDAIAEADRIAAETDQINDEMKALVEELLKQAEDNETELLDPSDLRQWVEQLESKDDLQEALRQYARFEKQLAQAEAALANREDEDLLSEAGEHLKSDAQTKELGEELVEKDYRAAEEELAELKPQDAEDIEEAEKELAKLRAASKQLAAAARSRQKRQGGESGGGSEATQASAGSEGAESSSSEQGDSQAKSSSSSGAEGSSEERSGDRRKNLASLMKEVDDASAEYEKALSKYGEAGDGSGEQEMSDARQSVGGSLDDMRSRLRQMAGSRDLMSKLSSMRSELAQRQGGLCETAGQSSAAASKSQSPGKNGKGVGAGPGSNSPDSVSPDTGKVTTLEGIKGDGPSLTSIEDAESGSGSSGAAGRERQVEFRHQVESFVHREDVPSPVRKGVQRYFENIHQPEE